MKKRPSAAEDALARPGETYVATDDCQKLAAMSPESAAFLAELREDWREREEVK